jgi:hypothetical protein
MTRFRFTDAADLKLKALILLSLYRDEKHEGQGHGI